MTRFMPVLVLVVLVGCGAPASPAGGGGPQTNQPVGPRGTLKIAWATEPENLSPKLAAGSGLNEYFWVFNSFLTYYDFSGAVHPMMARQVPSQEAGDWVVNPDGTMVTTYRLRENVRWHDGVPITAADFVFGFEVYVDPDMPIRDRVPETLMSVVEAPTDDTIVIRWKQPYVAANTLTFQQLSPLPRHLSEQKYRTNKANFVFGEDWTTAYVGNGPFRLDRWNPGASLVAKANTDWFLGPPKLDTVEIRFISDGRTQLANILAGEVDLINSPGVRAPEAVVARDQWNRNEGYIATWSRQTRFLAFQFRDVPGWQRAVTDVRVRRALMHATDREGIVGALTMGLGAPAHAFIVPTDALAADVDRAIMKYPYDVNRAGQLLGEVGWTRGSGSAVLTNALGQTLDIEIWTTPDGGGDEESAIMADNWKRVGVNSSVYHIPAARQRDLEHRVSFPAANASARSTTLDNFVFTSAHLPTPEARWQGANRGSFSDAEVDRFYNAALTTFNERDRREAVMGLHRRMAETLGVGMLYYNVELIIARARVKGPVGEVAEKSGMSWNVFEWAVTD